MFIVPSVTPNHIAGVTQSTLKDGVDGRLCGEHRRRSVAFLTLLIKSGQRGDMNSSEPECWAHRDRREGARGLSASGLVRIRERPGAQSQAVGEATRSDPPSFPERQRQLPNRGPEARQAVPTAAHSLLSPSFPMASPEEMSPPGVTCLWPLTARLAGRPGGPRDSPWGTRQEPEGGGRGCPGQGPAQGGGTGGGRGAEPSPSVTTQVSGNGGHEVANKTAFLQGRDVP